MIVAMHILIGMLVACLVMGAFALIDAFVLAFWRRWLGGMGGDFPRSIKITVLCLFIGPQYVYAVHPLLHLDSWSVAAIFAAPMAYIAAAPAILVLPLGLTALCLWFVVAHNNGGHEGLGGRARYGWAGAGFRDAWLRRDTIPERRIGGLVVVNARAWTEEGELSLGGRSGLIVGAALGLLAIIVSLFSTPV